MPPGRVLCAPGRAIRQLILSPAPPTAVPDCCCTAPLVVFDRPPGAPFPGVPCRVWHGDLNTRFETAKASDLLVDFNAPQRERAGAPEQNAPALSESRTAACECPRPGPREHVSQRRLHAGSP